MKIAFVGSLPAASVLPHEVIRERYRSGSHPAPWIQGLLPSLAAISGYELRVILIQRAISKPCLVKIEGVEYQGIPYHFPERFNFTLNHLPKSFVYRQALKNYRPDLVHAFGMETGSASIARRSGLPVSCFVQGIAEKLMPFCPQMSKLDRLSCQLGERRSVERIKWFIAETEFARTWVKCRNPSARVDLIAHPMRAIFFERAAPTFEKQFVSVGGFDDRKGMDTVIKAFALIEDKESRLCLVGSGPLEEHLKALATRLEIQDRVEFAGFLRTEELITKLNGSCALVIASRMDTSPNVVSEAHAIGLPVVGTRAGGIPEMIDEGKDGFLVDIDDEVAMGQRMSQLLRNREIARRMGHSGAEKVKVLNSPERVAAAHLNFFEHIGSELGLGTRADS